MIFIYSQLQHREFGRNSTHNPITSQHNQFKRKMTILSEWHMRTRTSIAPTGSAAYDHPICTSDTPISFLSEIR